MNERPISLLTALFFFQTEGLDPYNTLRKYSVPYRITNIPIVFNFDSRRFYARTFNGRHSDVLLFVKLQDFHFSRAQTKGSKSSPEQHLFIRLAPISVTLDRVLLQDLVDLCQLFGCQLYIVRCAVLYSPLHVPVRKSSRGE